jgi:hypothetical protein
MPAQPTNPQPTVSGPRKRQARLDDNGEPAGVPALKKMKSVEKNGPKKTAPAKTRQEKNKTPSVPLKMTPSIEIPARLARESSRDSVVTRKTNATSPPETVIVESSDDEDIEDIPEAPEEDAEAQLGAYYSTLFSNRKISY